jgi:hypothetical protein
MVPNQMRIATFSDWRVQPIEPLVELLKSEKPDLVLYGGDDTARFAPLDCKSITDFQMVKEFIFHNTFRPNQMERGYSGSRHFSGITTHYSWTPNTSEAEYLKQLRRYKREDGEHVYLYKGTKDKGESVYLARSGPSEPFFQKIAAHSKFGLGAVLGNDCNLIDKPALVGHGLLDLHEEPNRVGWLGLMGLQGAPIKRPTEAYLGPLLYDENDALNHLQEQWSLLQEEKVERVILVSHAPPEGVLDFALRFSGDNIGSKAVKRFIETHPVDLVVCGHCHYCGGLYTNYNDTIILNIASHDDRDAIGRLGWVTLKRNGNIRIEGATSTPHPIDWGGLYSLPQVGRKRLLELVKSGILGFSDLNEERIPSLIQNRIFPESLVLKWIRTIEARSQGVQYRTLHDDWTRIKECTPIVYDVETDLECRPWLIGVWDHWRNEVRQFFCPTDMSILLNDFFSFVKSFENHVLVSFSSTRYDQRCILKGAKENGLEVPEIIRNEIDLGILVGYYTIGLPHRNLKDLARHYGFEWKSPDLDGLSVGSAVSTYYRTGKEPDWDSFKAYNRDDVVATKIVLEKLLDLNLRR